ncbi:MAG: methylated-DNA--[protein]-cysteine S-methyltransferase [Balneolaceae bacterium]
MKSFYDSPIGWLELTASNSFLEKIHFWETNPDPSYQTNNDITLQTIIELEEYFDGQRTQFSVPVKPAGTNFQRSVWKKLQDIPYGKTVTYGELAENLGDANKVRAVGKANGSNPIPIIIPCHRVIGADNKLVGYAGGISRKRYLLRHEGAILL